MNQYPSKYVSKYVKNCAEHAKDNYKDKCVLPKTAPNPFPTGYEPGMDISLALIPEDALYLQTLIGIMRWMIKLGRIAIATEISLILSHLTYPEKDILRLPCM